MLKSSLAALALAFHSPVNVIPLVSIYPCAADFSCVSAGGREMKMIPAGGRLGDADVLATDAETAPRTFLIKARLGPKNVLALFEYDRTTHLGHVTMFGHEDLTHPSPEQIVNVVKDADFARYLTEAVADEAPLRTQLLSRMAQRDPSRLTSPFLAFFGLSSPRWGDIQLIEDFRMNLMELSSRDLYDSGVMGKVSRLQDEMNVMTGSSGRPAKEQSDYARTLEGPLSAAIANSVWK